MRHFISQLVSLYGNQIINEKRFVFLLDDLGAFSQMPKPTRHILLDLIESGYCKQIESAESWDLNVHSMIARYVDQTGFRPDLVEGLFTELAFGLGWKTENLQKQVAGDQIGLLLQAIKGKKLRRSNNETLADRLTRTSYDESDIRLIKNFKAVILEDGPRRNFLFRFVIDNASSASNFKFFYQLIGLNGQILEADEVKLADLPPKSLRTIEDIGKFIELESIYKIRYSLSFERKPSSLTKRQSPVTFQTLTSLSIWRQDLDSHVVNVIKYFNVKMERDGSLTMNFYICNYISSITYVFHYAIYDKSGKVLERDDIYLSGTNRSPNKTISDCGKGLDITEIGKIEYYLN